MPMAKGSFDVKVAPVPLHDAGQHPMLARMTLDKRFHGDLDAVSHGEMLSAGSPVKGSAGYVAIERVDGTLGGRRGSFALQHTGTMTRGVPSLSVTVVPDSGTDELAGLSGRMQIIISGKEHAYEFEYEIVPRA
jgi:hypothetical protein